MRSKGLASFFGQSAYPLLYHKTHNFIQPLTILISSSTKKQMVSHKNNCIYIFLHLLEFWFAYVRLNKHCPTNIYFVGTNRSVAGVYKWGVLKMDAVSVFLPKQSRQFDKSSTRYVLCLFFVFSLLLLILASNLLRVRRLVQNIS